MRLTCKLKFIDNYTSVVSTTEGVRCPNLFPPFILLLYVYGTKSVSKALLVKPDSPCSEWSCYLTLFGHGLFLYRGEVYWSIPPRNKVKAWSVFI